MGKVHTPTTAEVATLNGQRYVAPGTVEGDGALPMDHWEARAAFARYLKDWGFPADTADRIATRAARRAVARQT